MAEESYYPLSVMSDTLCYIFYSLTIVWWDSHFPFSQKTIGDTEKKKTDLNNLYNSPGAGVEMARRVFIL